MAYYSFAGTVFVVVQDFIFDYTFIEMHSSNTFHTIGFTLIQLTLYLLMSFALLYLCIAFSSCRDKWLMRKRTKRLLRKGADE